MTPVMHADMRPGMTLGVNHERMRVLRRTLVLIAVCGYVAGCAPTRPAREPAPPPRAPSSEPTVVNGFRIQISSTTDQAEADALVEEAVSWYEGLAPAQRSAELGGGELDVAVVWRAPYYRVQIGSFASRASADRALSQIARRYPDAFPVPATVVVRQ